MKSIPIVILFILIGFSSTSMAQSSLSWWSCMLFQKLACEIPESVPDQNGETKPGHLEIISYSLGNYEVCASNLTDALILLSASTSQIQLPQSYPLHCDPLGSVQAGCKKEALRPCAQNEEGEIFSRLRIYKESQK